MHYAFAAIVFAAHVERCWQVRRAANVAHQFFVRMPNLGDHYHESLLLLAESSVEQHLFYKRCGM
jgi:hypothetical protein